MTFRRRTMRLARLLVAGLTVVTSSLVGPHLAWADGVDQAQQNVDKTLAELENLQDQLGQLDEDYSAALDRQDQLAAEIQQAQADVDSMAAQLGGVEQLLRDVALKRLTTGGTSDLSPLFADASAYIEAEQRDALGNMAQDVGDVRVDDLQALLKDLNHARDVLADKQAEAAQIIATLESKQQQYNELEQVFLAKYEQAKADLGAAKLEAEQERRAAAAAAAQQAAAAQAAANSNTGSTSSPGRGGGGSTGGSTGGSSGGSSSGSGSSSGGGSSGGGSSGGGGGGTYIPPVSGKAGIAVNAAYGQLGVPYKFAAESPGVAFDCSGLTKYAWGQAGVYLPHQSAAQYASIPHIPKDQAHPGDLVFYYSPIGHVGIYIGNGQMIHAPQTGDVVKISVVHWNKVVGVGRPG